MLVGLFNFFKVEKILPVQRGTFEKKSEYKNGLKKN